MSMAATWALVPVKRLDRAKSRLAPHLSPPARQALQRSMLAHVLGELARTPGLDAIAIVTADAEAAALAARFGARHVPENATGLNPALVEGSAALAGLGARFIAIVPADLPELVAGDVAAALAEARACGDILVVPDRAGIGTNGLVFPAERPPRFAFGPDSYRRHLAEPGARAFPLASLARDLDRLEDLAALHASIPSLESLS
ncbi:MAG: 2-phospho-L-lactate guanylyltransferase [Sneathiellaceae bacterium]